MEQLKVRILLQHVKGATIAYCYNRESFDLLKIERNTFDGTQLIEIGNMIEFDGKKYMVKNVNFKMEKQLYEIDNKHGINLLSPAEPSEFNCQIGVFIDNV